VSFATAPHPQIRFADPLCPARPLKGKNEGTVFLPIRQPISPRLAAFQGHLLLEAVSADLLFARRQRGSI